MSSRVEEKCGCWTFTNDNDVIASSGMCAFHWTQRKLRNDAFSILDRVDLSETSKELLKAWGREPPARTFTLAEIIDYISAQKALYESISKVPIPNVTTEETTKLFDRASKVLAELIEQIRFGALTLHANRSRENAFTDHEKHTPHTPTNENPDVMRATNRDSGEPNES